MERVLFTTNPPRRCGVYEFGRSTWAALQCSNRYQYLYHEFDEATSADEFCSVVERVNPVAVLHNWHPATMGWLSDDILYELRRRMPAIRHASIVHDAPAPFHWIDSTVYIDPTHKIQKGEFSVGRRLWTRAEPAFDSGNIIGSFGFGLGGKGFNRVVQKVNQEFDSATIRLHIPCSEYCDPNGNLTKAVIEECKQLAKPGIHVEVSSDYLSTHDLMNWLAGNSVNCFFYDEFKGRGISSVIDFALSARRPIAISHSNMFRHIVDATPSILIEQSSLKQIIANGIEPLRPFLDRWTDADLVAGYDLAIDYAREQQDVDLVGNRVLTPRDRERLRPSVAELTELCPDIMSRKFPEAVFKNAFIFEEARKFAKTGDKIVLVGGYDDPIGPALARLGFDVTITDPQLDGRESTDVLRDAILSGTRYDMVISCSVIEHVPEDIEFVQTLYDLTVPGGTILLTTDFRDGWRAGMPKPTPDVRLYTLERLRLLANSLPSGSLLSPAAWRSEVPYFHYDGASYGFCSLAFKRLDSDVSDRYVARILAKDHKQKKTDNDALRAERNILSVQNRALLAQIQILSRGQPDSQINPYSTETVTIAQEPILVRPVRRSIRKRLSMSWKKRRREWKQGIANVKFIKNFVAQSSDKAKSNTTQVQQAG